jgi:hypothetical protein
VPTASGLRRQKTLTILEEKKLKKLFACGQWTQTSVIEEVCVAVLVEDGHELEIKKQVRGQLVTHVTRTCAYAHLDIYSRILALCMLTYADVCRLARCQILALCILTYADVC